MKQRILSAVVMIAILLACLIFTLTAPNYIWGIVGM